METFLNGDEVLVMSGRWKDAIGTIVKLRASVGTGGTISRVLIISGRDKGDSIGIFQSRFELINRGKHNPNLSFKRQTRRYQHDCNERKYK